MSALEPTAPAPDPAARGRAVFELLAEGARGGAVELRVRGSSMGPAVPDGARLRVRAAPRYRAGDVLVFLNRTGQLIAHRLLGSLPGRAGRRYVTRGDAAPAADGLVASDRVLGLLIGGEVEPRLWRVPLADRLRARAGFLRYLLGRMLT